MYPHPPRALSNRYARATTKSKSAFDAKRAAEAAPATKATKPQTSSSSVSVAASLGCARCSAENSEGGCRVPSVLGTDQEEQRAKGGRNATTAASWRDKLVAVQRRRAALECSMRDEAKRLVENRAKKEVLGIPAVCRVS